LLLDALEPLLCVDDLRAGYRVGSSVVSVLRAVSFEIQPGQVVALLGESGGGKSTAILAMLGLLPHGSALEGSARFQGLELIGAPEETLQKIRGACISYIPQEPLLSLNPVIRAIDQVAMVARAHERIGIRESRQRARVALQQAGLDESQLHNSYAHQLSGGQRQRVVIAQAIVNRPSLVIADEPAGALDAPSAQEILSLLRGLVQKMGASLLLITHDPCAASYIADRVMVMYAGRIVEQGPANDILRSPLHPYTRGLLRSVLNPPGASSSDRHVAAIEGSPPDFRQLPNGCTFHPRCPDRMLICADTAPPLTSLASHQTCCFLYDQPR